MKDIVEIRDWLLENAVDDDGDLVLIDLDFSDFEGNVYIDDMKVKGDLSQCRHEVQGALYQCGHEAQGHLLQHGHEVQGHLHQYGHEVKGNLLQYNHEVQGDLSQSWQKVQGDLLNEDNKYGGKLYENTSTKLLKEVTLEELSELGYKLKGE